MGWTNVRSFVRSLDLFMPRWVFMRMLMHWCPWWINTNTFVVNHWFWSIQRRENSSSNIVKWRGNRTRFSIRRSLPLAKFAFDFGRLPLHWIVPKALLTLLGYKELLNHSKQEILAALRLWMTEDTHQVDRNTLLMACVWSRSSPVRRLRS